MWALCNALCKCIYNGCSQGLGVEQLRVLATLPRLVVLNLCRTTWTNDAISIGPTLLAAKLSHLRVLSAPCEALVRITTHAGVLPLLVIILLKLPERNSTDCISCFTLHVYSFRLLQT